MGLQNLFKQIFQKQVKSTINDNVVKKDDKGIKVSTIDDEVDDFAAFLKKREPKVQDKKSYH